MVGVYSATQPVVTIFVSQVVVSLTPPPHFNLTGVNAADLGALAIVAGVTLVVYKAGGPAGETHEACLDQNDSCGATSAAEQRLLGTPATDVNSIRDELI